MAQDDQVQLVDPAYQRGAPGRQVNQSLGVGTALGAVGGGFLPAIERTRSLQQISLPPGQYYQARQSLDDRVLQKQRVARGGSAVGGSANPKSPTADDRGLYEASTNLEESGASADQYAPLPLSNIQNLQQHQVKQQM